MEEIRIEDIKKRIQSGKTVLGIELGSTRIKGVLLTEEGELIADGSHQWENRLENGIWTYSMEAVWKGMQECYGDLKTKVREAYGAEIETIGGIGISAMMHGYLAFGTIPHMEKYHNGAGFAGIDGRLPLSYPPALEYRSSVSGSPERRSSCKRY